MTHLALIGQGAIVRALLPALPGLCVERVSVLARPGRAAAARALPGVSEAVEDVDALIALGPALAVEAAGQQALAEHGPALLAAGIPLIAASVGALAEPETEARLRAAARRGGSRLHLPSGAIGGLDALGALAGSGGVTLEYQGTKPPRAWPPGSPEGGEIFAGSAREAARAFPKNANVAAAVALAGPGLDATRVHLLADPEARGNRHHWRAEGAAGRIEMTIESTPAPGNAATSLLTVHSLARSIRNLTGEIAL
ncbi:MAG: aspartate dehydrogenase [Alphaproteobacteria bacterium]|nr:MAG: aspartate dehydrogenase [Alphaproteobacteria bacterium]